jgi:hypothetical protein
MILAAAEGLDGTRHVAAPYPDEATWTDEAGNFQVGARRTSWVRRHAFTSPEEWIPWIEAQAKRRVERERQAALDTRLGETVLIHCTPLRSTPCAPSTSQPPAGRARPL